MIELHVLKELCQRKAIRVTRHALTRMLQRKITLSVIEYAIMNGRIIEQYPDDYPYPSCLLFALTPDPIHIVCSVNGKEIWLVTAYRPDLDQWENDYKTRRRREK